MSLQVWLPLNGDLHNQGLADITATNNGATINNNGKIGKCYSFGTSTSYLTLPKEVMTSFTNECSVCFWIKILSWNTSYATYFQAGLGAAPWSNYIFGLLRNSTNSTCCFTISNGSTASNTSYQTPTLELNTWYHIGLCYKTGHCLIYINGQLYRDNTTTIIPNFSAITTITIGTCNTKNSYQTNCLMNDFRIYNHCLSNKEIEEIAKGLILHYKLDDRFCESTTNLCDNLVNGGRTTIVDNVLINTGENSDTYWYIKPKEALVGDATYTVSCYLSGFSSNSTYISWGVCAQSGANSAGSWKCYNGFNEFTFTMPSRLDGSTANIIFDDNGGTRTEIFSISQVQLEKKDHATGYAGPGGSRIATTIYDSSGYDNNGIIIGSLETTTLSPRYKYATHFDGNTACIKIPYNDINPDRIFTVNLWFYKNALGPKKYETLFGGPAGFEMDTRAGAATSLSLYMASTRGSTVYSPLNLNEWIMITMVRDGTNEFYYVNGELKKTIEAKSMPSGQYRIGAWASDTGQNYYGEISDFRIYATALTPEQILELYHTSATIDNMGNAYARELVEI